MASVPDPRSIDCKDWAIKKVMELRGQSDLGIIILLIKPKLPARYLGPYKTTKGDYRPEVGDTWTHHFAVIHDNKVMDECYQNGLSLDAYKQLFEYADELEFIQQTGFKR